MFGDTNSLLLLIINDNINIYNLTVNLRWRENNSGLIRCKLHLRKTTGKYFAKYSEQPLNYPHRRVSANYLTVIMRSYIENTDVKYD